MDPTLPQLAIPVCQKGPPSPGRSRRAKSRYRKVSTRGSCGELAEPGGAKRLEPCAALRGLQHDLLLRKMSSSSPDLISTTLGAEGRKGASGPESPPTEQPRSETPSEDTASVPCSSSPESPSSRQGAVGPAEKARLQPGEEAEREQSRGGRAGSAPQSQHLTPAAMLYRAAVTRSQVSQEVVERAGTFLVGATRTLERCTGTAGRHHLKTTQCSFFWAVPFQTAHVNHAHIMCRFDISGFWNPW